MKIILLFDSDKTKNIYREYELSDGLDKELRKGGRITATFCHPNSGEVMEFKLDL